VRLPLSLALRPPPVAQLCVSAHWNHRVARRSVAIPERAGVARRRDAPSARVVLANRLVSLAIAVRPGEEQFAARARTQLIDARVPLALMSGRGPARVLLLLLLLLLLPRRVSLHRYRRLQTLHVHGLGVKSNGSVDALQLEIGQTGG